ncbi:hypothetical protein Glove_120g9 [Diversispora epigaea]|uniref:Uncharacterized protein n=1 Tax=Diversispora epigaea TaxID=1348612 RepID=A0A397J9Q9_9GLOM|nr:hypothetical protein Glove_120g9 [Diversispora epigaea]
MKQIWDRLMDYKNRGHLAGSMKRYIIANKMKYLWEGDLGHAIGVNIVICYSCNKLVYSNIGSIRRYELWIQNAIRRVKRAREIGRKIRDVKVIQEKWLEYFYRPDGLCASELALHYQLLWAVQEEIRQINNV